MQRIDDDIKATVKKIIQGNEKRKRRMLNGNASAFDRSLICTDPYFKDLSDVEVVMASWVSDWYFENGFDINGVEFGHREAELVKGFREFHTFKTIKAAVEFIETAL